MKITTKFDITERVFRVSDKDSALYTVQAVIVDSSGISYICIDANGVGEVMAESDLI